MSLAGGHVGVKAETSLFAPPPPPTHPHHTHTHHKQADRDKEQDTAAELTIDLDSPVPSLLSTRATKVTLASCTLFLCVAALVCLGTIVTVTSKVMTIPMANYTAALTLETVFAYIPLTFFYMAIKHRRGLLRRSDLQYPWRPVTIVAFLYALGQVLFIYGTQYTSGPVQVILSQSAIPFSMVISKYMLGSTYRKRHYCGALLVFSGILLTVCASSLGKEEIDSFEAGWIVGYILSWLPYVTYTVYSESLYKNRSTPPDPIIFTGIISAVQFLFLCLLVPAFPLLQRPPMHLDTLPASLAGGLRCLVGINTLPSDDCALAPAMVLTYNILNLVLLYPTFALLEHGSSNLFWLACTLIVPLSGFAFSLPFIPGHEPVQWINCLALLVIVVGLGIYGFSKKTVDMSLNYLLQASSPRHALQPTVASSSENLTSLLEMTPGRSTRRAAAGLPRVPPSPAQPQEEEDVGDCVGGLMVDEEEDKEERADAKGVPDEEEGRRRPTGKAGLFTSSEGSSSSSLGRVVVSKVAQ